MGIPTDCPGLVRIYRYGHLESLLGKNLLNVLRPFDNTRESAVDIVIKTDVKRFGDLCDPIKVEMEQGSPVPGLIFVDDSERG